jgi:hypothetical protein
VAESFGIERMSAELEAIYRRVLRGDEAGDLSPERGA